MANGKPRQGKMTKQKTKFRNKGFVETDEKIIRLNRLHKPDQITMDMIGIGKQNRKTFSGKKRVKR